MAHIEGFGGFGRRPALAVIDMTLGFTDPGSPLACDLEAPISEIQKLLSAARRAEIPIVFTTVAYRESDKLTAAAFIDKVPALLTLQAGTRWAEIDPRIAPEETEPVLNKLFASGFFGTGLSSLLTAAGKDTLIITGASTSGCVRGAVCARMTGYASTTCSRLLEKRRVSPPIGIVEIWIPIGCWCWPLSSPSRS